MLQSSQMVASIWPLTLIAFLLLSLSRLSSATTTEPAPLIVQPSQYWEGNDGPWSTFWLSAGTDGNVTRVLVSTAIPNTWVVLAEACSSTDCAKARGDDLFNPNSSKTWKEEGIYNLFFESNLNYTGNGEYGFDQIALGLQPTNDSTLSNQVIAGIVAEDFWLGYFGINPQPTNFSNFQDPQQSFFKTLQTQNRIPSLTYSYTAGAQYQLKGVFGQLIFGGYDASKFMPNSVTFNMAGDVTRDLVVGVQSVYSTENSGKTTNYLSGGVLAYVDSTVPYIILPDSACDQFENAFGLSVDAKTGLYLVSDSQHSSLTSRNPNFTFVLGNSESGGSTVSISLPYAAFDLEVSSPIVNTTTKYFPLKRGNDTTYTLGRAFLQEAYLTVDYERSNFSISQSVFTNNPEQILPIHNTSYVAPPSSSNSTSGGASGGSGSGSGSGITTGAIAGIAVAGALVIAAIITLALLRRFRKWPFHKHTPLDKAELDAQASAVGHEKDGRALAAAGGAGAGNLKTPPGDIVEADSKTDLAGYYRPELAGSGGHPVGKNELPGGGVGDGLKSEGPARELYGSHAASEVEGSRPVMELAGSPVGPEYYYRGEPGDDNISAVSSREPNRHASTSQGPSRGPSRQPSREPSPAGPSWRGDGRRLGSASSPLSPSSADGRSPGGRSPRSPGARSPRSPGGLSAAAASPRLGRSPISPESEGEDPISREVSRSRSRPRTGPGTGGGGGAGVGMGIGYAR